MRAIGWLLLAAGLVWTVPVAADPVAESLYNSGVDLMKAGDFDEACPKLAASQSREPLSGTLITLAQCHRLQGKTATAWSEFRQAAAMATTEKREEYAKRAKAEADELEAKLSKLRVDVTEQHDAMTVTLDGSALDAASFGTAVAIDPGSHTLAASAPGHVAWSSTIVIPQGPALEEVKIPKLEPEAASPQPVVPAPQPSKPPPREPTPAPRLPDDGGSGSTAASALMISGFGLAGAGLVVFAVGGGVALDRGATLEEECPGDVCARKDEPLLSDALAAAHAATAGLVIFGAGAALGLVGVILGTTSSDDGSVTITPRVGFGSLELSGTF